MFQLFVQYLQKYELLFHVMLVTIMPWPSLLSLHISKHLKGLLGPHVGDVTFLDQMEVSWDPVLVT